MDVFDFEIDSDGSDESGGEGVIRISQQQTCFADSCFLKGQSKREDHKFWREQGGEHIYL